MGAALYFFLLVWLFPALFVFLTEAIDARTKTAVEYAFAALAGLLWPLFIPFGLWVALNPRKAERIRQRYGAAASPTPDTAQAQVAAERQQEPRADLTPNSSITEA